jgi:hypothetical protein
LKTYEEEMWNNLSNEMGKLGKEYAKLKNMPKLPEPFETKSERGERIDQTEKVEAKKLEEFNSLKDDFKKKREYILGLREEVRTLKLKERKNKLEEKLKDQESITEKELLELLALNKLIENI